MMDADERIDLKLTSDPDFIEAFADEVARVDAGYEITSKGRETDPSNLAFSLGDIASVVGLFSDLLMTGPIVPALIAAIRRTKPKKIVITSPFHTLVFEPREEMTEEQVRAVLRKLVEVV